MWAVMPSVNARSQSVPETPRSLGGSAGRSGATSPTASLVSPLWTPPSLSLTSEIEEEVEVEVEVEAKVVVV